MVNTQAKAVSNAKRNEWDNLLLQERKYSEYAFPKVSIIIPTLNCSESIPTTLESILSQDYPDYEIIIIDGGSTDRTLEVVNGFSREHTRISSVSQYSRYEMLNKGISHAMGVYITFLFPGDFYIYYQTLKLMMELALKYDKPHLVYCGCALHDASTMVKTLNRPMTLDLLRSGRQPTSLQSCWFRADTFRRIGRFPTNYVMRGGFDLMCRFLQDGELRSVSSSRILTDYDLRGINRRQVLLHFWETMRSLHHRFGFAVTLRWLLFQQKDLRRYLRLWLRSIKVAFIGQ